MCTGHFYIFRYGFIYMPDKMYNALTFIYLPDYSCTKKDENPYYITVPVYGQSIDTARTDIPADEANGLYSGAHK